MQIQPKRDDQRQHGRREGLEGKDDIGVADEKGVVDGHGLRSARKIASEMLWVTKSTVLRSCSQIRSISSCSTSRVCASSPPNGSSITRTEGSFASARANATRCF